MEQQINEKIIEIVHQANDMIPVEWDDLYINFEVDRTLSGEIYFFFKYMESTIISFISLKNLAYPNRNFLTNIVYYSRKLRN